MSGRKSNIKRKVPTKSEKHRSSVRSEKSSHKSDSSASQSQSGGSRREQFKTIVKRYNMNLDCPFFQKEWKGIEFDTYRDPVKYFLKDGSPEPTLAVGKIQDLKDQVGVFLVSGTEGRKYFSGPEKRCTSSSCPHQPKKRPYEDYKKISVTFEPENQSIILDGNKLTFGGRMYKSVENLFAQVLQGNDDIKWKGHECTFLARVLDLDKYSHESQGISEQLDQLQTLASTEQ